MCPQSQRQMLILDANKFIVALFNTKFKAVTCGGTLVSKSHVVTAVHCFSGMQFNHILVKKEKEREERKKKEK